jgi:hypothetical protein
MSDYITGHAHKSVGATYGAPTLETPKSGHWFHVSGCPLCAKSGHEVDHLGCRRRLIRISLRRRQDCWVDRQEERCSAYFREAQPSLCR